MDHKAQSLSHHGLKQMKEKCRQISDERLGSDNIETHTLDHELSDFF